MYDLSDKLGNRTVYPGTNVLVTGPPLAGKQRVAFSILASGAERGNGSIVVTTRDSATTVEETVGSLRADLDAPEDAPLGIVDCVTKSQSTSVQDTDEVKYTASPSDMTGIGIRFSELLESFHDQGLERNRVLLDSLSTLLLYSDLETVFRFVHVFTSRIENADALGVVVMDSTAHDPQTVNTIRQLFDGLIEIDEDGEVSATVPDVDPDAPRSGG